MGKLSNIITRLKNRILDYRPKKTISLNENHKHIRFFKGYSGGALLLPKPITFEDKIHNIFNENYLYPSEESYFIEVKKGFVFRRYDVFSVMDNKRNLLAEVSVDSLKRTVHPAFLERINTKPKKLKGKTLMLATLGCDNVYYHWIMDLLPRLNVLIKNDVNLSSFDQIIINPIKYPFQKESLKFLGIRENQLIHLEENSLFSCEKLFVPSIHNHHPSNIKFLRRTFIKESLNFPEKRIFITRENSEWRNITNNNEFTELLDKFKFTKVVLEKLSLKEQIELFKDAQIIIGVHGAGLTNLVFSSPQSTIIEITANWKKNVDYWISASYSSLHYHLVESNTIPNIEELNYNYESVNFNIEINIDKLKNHIELAVKRYER